jgi:hypothetical protein
MKEKRKPKNNIAKKDEECFIESLKRTNERTSVK